MFSFKDVGLQCLHLPEATHGAMSALHNSPEGDCDAREACLNTLNRDCTISDENVSGRRFPKPRL